jgi:hypothetical protein
LHTQYVNTAYPYDMCIYPNTAWNYHKSYTLSILSTPSELSSIEKIWLKTVCKAAYNSISCRAWTYDCYATELEFSMTCILVLETGELHHSWKDNL